MAYSSCTQVVDSNPLGDNKLGYQVVEKTSSSTLIHQDDLR